jgi:hypothetical protein
MCRYAGLKRGLGLKKRRWQWHVGNRAVDFQHDPGEE